MHKGGLNPHSFHFTFTMRINTGEPLCAPSGIKALKISKEKHIISAVFPAGKMAAVIFFINEVGII